MERIAVIGLGRFGLRLARLLAQSGAEVIAIDRRRELVEEVGDDVDRAVCLDSTDEEALLAQGVDKVDTAIVGIGADFEAGVLATVVLKKIGVPRVISRATSNIRAQILSSVGADDIANPERESAQRWCGKLLAPSIMERIALTDGYSLVQVAAPEGFMDRTIEDVKVRTKYKVNIIAIRRVTEEIDADGKKTTRESVISVPMADAMIKPGDVLLIIGGNDAIASFPAE